MANRRRVLHRGQAYDETLGGSTSQWARSIKASRTSERRVRLLPDAPITFSIVPVTAGIIDFIHWMTFFRRLTKGLARTDNPLPIFQVP